jgi:hypothetical protein
VIVSFASAECGDAGRTYESSPLPPLSYRSSTGGRRCSRSYFSSSKRSWTQSLSVISLLFQDHDDQKRQVLTNPYWGVHRVGSVRSQASVSFTVSHAGSCNCPPQSPRRSVLIGGLEGYGGSGGRRKWHLCCMLAFTSTAFMPCRTFRTPSLGYSSLRSWRGGGGALPRGPDGGARRLSLGYELSDVGGTAGLDVGRAYWALRYDLVKAAIHDVVWP